MKKVLGLVIIAFCCFSKNVKAQNDSLQNAVMALPADSSTFDKTYTKCENPATYPGGLEGWKHYLETHLEYPKKAQKHSTQGVVRVQLTVDKDGNVKDVKALNNPGDGLAEEAEKAIRLSGKWIPATQNGRRVTYRFAQTITFLLA